VETDMTPEGYPDNKETARDALTLLRQSGAQGDGAWAALVRMQREVAPQLEERGEPQGVSNIQEDSK
jgi:hypothetical protein